MRSLPNTDLTYDELDLLEEDNLYNYGGEAIVCRTSKPNTLYKIFTTSDMSANKLRKIEKLYQEELPFSTRPVSTLTVEGNLIGYEQTFDPNDISMFDAILTREEKLYFLRLAKEALTFFATKDIVYGDVKSDNILINPITGTLRFCDMDNIRIGNHPIDVYGDELLIFLENGGREDVSDAFMHNLLTIEQLHYEGQSQFEILKGLKGNSLHPPLPPAASKALEKMLDYERYNGESIIQYIKK